MRAGTIVITHPNGFEQELTLGEGTTRVGSAADCDLILAGTDIAPHHATIACDDHGRLVIEIRGENIVGQGGMRLTLSLAQITRRRDLAWFGDYVLSYRPATWNCRTQPLSQADLPASTRVLNMAARRLADETVLLCALLGQGPTDDSPEATTLAMPLMTLAACDA